MINISEQKIAELVLKELSAVINSDPDKHPLRAANGNLLIPVGISNRHIHLTEGVFKKLFGEQASLDSLRPLYQPGEFASKQTLSIAGPKMRSITGVRILGPLRSYDQVELSLTDAVYLGIKPPVVNSGDLKNAEPLTLIGPNGSVYIEKCAIIANRHIHMTTEDSKRFGVKEGDLCRVRIGGVKGVVYENVLIRINDNWRLQIHLDTDDANAAYIRDTVYAEFIGIM